MPEPREIKPEARIYYEKIAQLWEEIGDKRATANWLSFLGEEEKANRLYGELAEEHLARDDKWMAIDMLKKAGDEQKTNEVARGLVQKFMAEGDKYEAAYIYKIIGKNDEAQGLFLECAKEQEQKASSLPEDSKESQSAEYKAMRSYEEAKDLKEVRRLREARVQRIVEATGEPDSLLIAEELEALGYTEMAKQAYLKKAKLFEEVCSNLKYSLAVSMPVSCYAKAGETEKAKEVLRQAAEVAEKNEKDLRQAIVFYAKIKDETEVRRLLNKIIEDSQKENDKKKLADGLLDLWFLDKSQERLEKAKTAYLGYAKEMEASPDLKVKEKAIHGYREAADIINGTIQPILEFYWGKI